MAYLKTSQRYRDTALQMTRLAQRCQNKRSETRKRSIYDQYCPLCQTQADLGARAGSTGQVPAFPSPGPVLSAYAHTYRTPTDQLRNALDRTIGIARLTAKTQEESATLPFVHTCILGVDIQSCFGVSQRHICQGLFLLFVPFRSFNLSHERCRLG